MFGALCKVQVLAGCEGLRQRGNWSRNSWRRDGAGAAASPRRQQEGGSLSTSQAQGALPGRVTPHNPIMANIGVLYSRYVFPAATGFPVWKVLKEGREGLPF